MEFKGTKEKWNYEKGTYLENTIFFSFNNGEIIKVSNINDNDEATEETKANALLISKAPEMLEILNRIHYDISNRGCLNNVGLNDIEQLIKEATEI